MVDQNQYIIANDGFSLGYRESNGLAASGMLNLKFAPTAYRAPMTSHPAVMTSGRRSRDADGRAAARDLPGRRRAVRHGEHQRWQNDPFYNYIPWQKTPAAFHGLGDDHAGKGGPTGAGGWIEVVKTITTGLPGAPAGGVDLCALSTVTEFATRARRSAAPTSRPTSPPTRSAPR